MMDDYVEFAAVFQSALKFLVASIFVNALTRYII